MLSSGEYKIQKISSFFRKYDYYRNISSFFNKKERTMSKPSAPYYYKENSSDAYHWEILCSKNHYPDPGWKKSDTAPSGREQCNECKSK